MLMKKGTLADRANAHNRFTNATLLGSLEGEDFRDVEVVTLKQYARDCAHREILDTNSVILSYEDLEIKVQDLVEREYSTGKEFILIEDERILVGLNVDKIDQRAVDRATTMLVEIDDFTSGKFLVFGEPITLFP